jgi:hypothetical protein
VRPIRFLLPGTTGRFRGGGLLVELQTARLTSQLTPTEVVTYRQREPDHPFLDDLLDREPAPGDALWIVSWGFDVPRLLRRLRGRPLAYHAHSSGYGFSLPPGVPLFLVPNALQPQWLERGNRAAPAGVGRPIDVLVQQRKNSRYVLERLVPALRRRGLRVEVQSGWVDDLVDLFNSAAVVLYDSADYWRGRGVSEGFGLPPLEAMACGCVVFSSLNHALADSLDPGVVGHQIGCGSLEHDLERIQAAVADPLAWLPPPARLANLLEACSEPVLQERWHSALETIDAHWERLLGHGVTPLTERATWRIRLEQFVGRARHRLGVRLPRWPAGN